MFHNRIDITLGTGRSTRLIVKILRCRTETSSKSASPQLIFVHEVISIAVNLIYLSTGLNSWLLFKFLLLTSFRPPAT